ncbi:MAG TPA: TonB family protein [Bryobacteraceae bacterium]|nr:TonB family protein [Bryobacteraceae bacterium]
MAGQGDQELNLLRQWREPITPRRFARAALGSLGIHLAVLAALVVALGNGPVRNGSALYLDVRRSVPLYMPQDLTQRDINKGRITRTLDVRSSTAPAAVPQAPRFRPPEPSPVAALPAPAVVEPPKIEAEAAPPPPPPPSAGRLPQPAPPPPDKPKLAFENVGAGGTQPQTNPNPASKVPDPRAAAENALRASVQPNQGSAGLMVGDIEEMTVAPSPNAPSTAGPVRSNLQLLSDPKGVDFKPYLIQVLTVVRTNWLAVIPESARLGRKGRVLVQFIIDRRGGIPKLVIAESSGAAALDRAAVAGISASNPLPPLPTGFQGNEIRLQLAFSYNQPAR